MKDRQTVWISFEETPNYTFTQIHYSEQEVVEHVRLRKTSITNTEMEGRNISWNKYKRLE